MRRFRWICGVGLALGLAVLVASAAVHIAQRAEAGVALTNVELLLDCDASTAAIDTNCLYPDGTTTVDAAVVLKNNGPAFKLGSFGFYALSSPRPIFTPDVVSCLLPLFDCNPDFDQSAVGSTDWLCGAPNPTSDNTGKDTDPETSWSFLSCFNTNQSGPMIATSGLLRLATVHYTATGSVATDLKLLESFVADETFTDTGSCDPAREGPPMTCGTASVQIGDNPPTRTPTFTPTGSPTLTPTPTATQTPPPTPSGTPTGAVTDIVAFNESVCVVASIFEGVAPIPAIVSCFVIRDQARLQALVECLLKRPFCGQDPQPNQVFQRVDPVDLALIDQRDAEQVHAGQVLDIVAMVDGDYPVLFESDRGSFIHPLDGTDAGTSILCWSALLHATDPDCDADPTTVGDGAVALRLQIEESDPRGPASVTVTQGLVSKVYDFNIVGPPVAITLESLDDRTQIETGALPRTFAGEIPDPAACDIVVDPPYSGATSPKKTNVLVRAFDSDGIQVVTSVNWQIPGDDPFNLASLGKLPEGGASTPQHPLWNLGSEGVGFVATVCGGSSPGLFAVDVKFERILDPMAPESYVLPYEIDVVVAAPPIVPPTPTPCTDDLDCDGVLNADDNCARTFNPGQENSDRNFIDNSPPFKPAIDDITRVNSDPRGDACDIDDDNDRLSDIEEVTASPCPQATAPTDPLNADTDGDGFLDGPECGSSSDPASAASTPRFTDCGPPGGSDLLETRIEYCRYNSNPLSSDTDGDQDSDGGSDMCEAASLNNDRVVNSGDQGMLGVGVGGRVPYHANLDINKDGVLNSGDQGLQALLVVAYQLAPDLPLQYLCPSTTPPD